METPNKIRRNNGNKDVATTHIRDMVEAFLIRLKRGKYASSTADRSQTVNAALEACNILKTIVEHYAEYVQEKNRLMAMGQSGSDSGDASPSSSAQKRALLERKFSMGFASTANIAGSTAGLGHGQLPPGVKEVQEVITQLTKAGRSLQRASAFRLLLANVARRVLFIVRESAASSTTTMAALEAQFISEEEAQQGYPSVPQVFSEDASDEEDAEHNQRGAGGDDEDEMELEMDTPAYLENNDGNSAAGGGMAPKHTMKGTDHGHFPATQPQKISTPPSSGKKGSLFDQPQSNSGDTDFIDHTPPTDGVMLTRVESTYTKADGGFGTGMPGSGSIPGAANNYSGELQPIDFMEFVDRTLCGIGELETELERMNASLCDHAAKQLYNGEVVLTLGCSHTMINFLLTAAKSKQFQVIILEGAPLGGSQVMVNALREKGIDTRVLPDSSCWAVMSKASKVFISTNNVLANGGLLAPIGTHPVCLVAKQFSVPVITVTISLKLCPYYPSDTQCTSLVKISKTEAQEVPWSTYECPLDVLPTDEWHLIEKSGNNSLIVDNPITEYVPPHLISLFVTNDGEYTVPQIHRLVREHYHAEDGHL